MTRTNKGKFFKFLNLDKMLLLLMLLGLSVGAAAQGKSLTGKVTDSAGDPIPGVSVIIKGTQIGTITNLDGIYELNNDAVGKSTVIFSFIGMESAELAVNGASVLNVPLKSEVLEMKEVVVVGYGTQAKKDVTGSVSLINEKDMESRPNTQIGALMMGKAAGVRVQSNSGKPSEGFSVRIRGTNSINGSSDPLYVVDGVPTGDTRSINPSDVESISILKDASSAAIYGTAAANGVVIITTKKGRSEKPVVTLDAYAGFSQVWKTLPVLNGEQYRDLMGELGKTTDWSLYNKNTDWQNEIFQNGASSNIQLSVSGKSNKTSYYLSGGTMEQKGSVRSSEMKRSNFKINLDQEINDWFSVGTRIAFTKYDDVDVNDNNGVGQGGVLLGALTTPSVIGIFNPNGTYTSNPFQLWENPLSSTDASIRGYRKDRLLGNAYLTISPIKDLAFKSSLGIDNNNSVYDFFLDPFKTDYGRAQVGKGICNAERVSYYVFSNTLTYKRKIDKHAFDLLAGTEIQQTYWDNNEIEHINFAGATTITPNAGAIITKADSKKSHTRNASFMGRVNYAYNDKYLFTSNFRADGSSKFGKEHRWGYFPSVSAGWRISRENFMDKIEFLNDLKFRATWGVGGKEPNDKYGYLGIVNTDVHYPIGLLPQPGSYPSSLNNPKLKWETTEQYDLGLDLAIFNSRVKLTVDAYKKVTSDLLLDAPIPTTTGFGKTLQNVGGLENSGFEFALSTVNVDRAVNWTTDFNISFNKNRVTNILGDKIYKGGVAGRGEACLVQEGSPLGTLFGYKYGGVDPTTGNAYYIDKNGASTFTPSADDRVVIGDANPDFFYGFTNSVTYKGISLMVFLEGQQGNDILNATRMDTEGMSDAKNQSTAVLRRWRNPGDVTDIPKSSFDDLNNSRISTRFIEDGSYLRVKTLTLSYTLPHSWVTKIKLNNVRFYATAENLLTFTNYSGFDPEVNAFQASNSERGVDFGTYPQSRNYIFGANIEF